MIGLKCRHNGQWLQGIVRPGSVTCTVHDAKALSFASEDEALLFLRDHGLASYFEAQRSLCRAGQKGRRRSD